MRQRLSEHRTGGDPPHPPSIGVRHAVPLDQPESVAQIVQRLFPAYEVQGGRVHLAGCSLEERLYVRMRCRWNGHVLDLYTDADGNQVEPDLIETLGLGTVRGVNGPPPGMAGAMARFLTHHVPRLRDRFPSDADVSFCSAVALWCKHVQGKLRFTIRQESVELPFSGWARSFRAPPYVCPHTGQETFRIAMTDDGLIAAAEQIVSCADTGRRVLVQETAVCAATGKRVLAERVQRCPVSGDTVLPEAMVACAMCGERVAPGCVKKDRCAACRELRPADKTDPRLARLLQAYPDLERWGAWRLAETSAVFILSASSWLNRVLVVADKQTLALRRVAGARRFWPNWEVASPDRQDQVMREP